MNHVIISQQRQLEFQKKGLVDNLPQSLFKKNRSQFIKMFKNSLQSNLSQNQVAFFKGASEVSLGSSDSNYPEYQESYFYYLFGVTEMDCYGIIEFDTEKCIVFFPKLDNFYKIWMTVLDTQEYQKKYDLIDEILFTDSIEQYFIKKQPTKVFINKGINSDSGLSTLIPEEKYYVILLKTRLKLSSNIIADTKHMHNILAESRVYKTDEELEVMRWASIITCEAHCETMRNCKPGLRECQLESFFNFHCQQKYFCGRVQPYLSICGCGPKAATLHYHENEKWLQDGQTMLTDQGHQVHHYVSDVTTSFPVNGKFTQKQKEIYNIVLKANRIVMNNLKPGVNWLDMHLLAERTSLQGLKELGLLNGDIDEMMEQRLGFIFQPCGLGHLIGLDVHDVGGYLNNDANNATPLRSSKPGLKSLRTTRILQNRMCITIEPGIYFRDFLLNGELESLNIDLKFLNRNKIAEYQKEVSGVRIEDVVYINENGCENLSFGVPRTVDEIESCMRGEDWTLINGGKC